MTGPAVDESLDLDPLVLSGPIVAAVTRAINEDSGDAWYIVLPGGCGHGFHVDYRQRIDAVDSDIMRRLARDGLSNRAGLIRDDATGRLIAIAPPWWIEDRRQGERLGEQFRKVPA